MGGKENLSFVYGGGRAESLGAELMRWFLPIMLSLGCSVGSAQIEPNAGKWKTWVLTSGDQLRLPPPPDQAATRAEIAQLKDIAKQRNAGTLERIIWWNAGPPGYRWTSIAIPPGPASATLHSRIMALLSVAIYDATVAAWDSKYAYNRLHPTAFDPSLTAALPNPQSPSYPSEHAVIAGAASTVLAYLFPDKADDLKALASLSFTRASHHELATRTERRLPGVHVPVPRAVLCELQ